MVGGPTETGPRDIGYPRAVLVGLAIAIAVTLAVAAGTSTAAFGVYNPTWDGAADLRATASAVGTESEVVLNASRYGSVQQDDTVAVVLAPEERYGETDLASIRAFVRSGGTLVVAEDFGEHSNGILQAVGADARFDGTLLRDERYNYRSPAMPVARNVSEFSNVSNVSDGTNATLAGHATLVAGVDALTLNHGTVVHPDDATVLVRSSGYGYLDGNANGDLDEDERLRSYPVATVESVGEGRVVAVSDPSLFINVMLDRPGNRQFARNLVASGDRVLLDYSHAGRLPVLAVAVLVLRQRPVLQVVLGLAGLVAVGAWGRGLFGAVAQRLPWRGPERPPSRDGTDAADAADVTAYLRRTHPDWDEEAVLTQRPERRGDE